MDIINSLRSEFDVINDKLDIIAKGLKDGCLNNSEYKVYNDLNLIREEIDYINK